MKILPLFVLALMICACTTNKNMTKAPKKFDEIAFGNQGGITGMQKSYLIESNGGVYKVLNDSNEKLTSISRKEVKAISKMLRQDDIYNLEMNETGNMTYFIELKSGEVSKKITWASGEQNNALFEVYKKLTSTLKTISNE